MPSRPVLWLGGFLALGVALRTLYLLTPALDSDMAIVGLMARHILQGEFPIFFWGQPFAGTMESHLAAFLFYLFGPSRLTLALSPFLFSLAFLVVTYRLAREAFDRQVGLLALLLAAIPAPFLVRHSVTARANYIENLLLGAVIFLLTLRVVRESGPPRRRFLLLLGFFGGLAWYQSPQSIHYLLTSAIFVLLNDVRLIFRKEVWLLPPAFLLGSLPFWIYNLRASESTVGAISSHARVGGVADSLSRYLAEKVPHILGVAIRGGGVELSLALLVLGLYALAFLRLFYGWRSRGNQLLLLFLLITSAIIVLGFNRGVAIRYLLPLHSVLPIMMALFLVTLRRWRFPAFVIALVAVLVANLAGNLKAAEVFNLKERELYRWRLAHETQLFDLLQARGLTRAYVFSFWEAYRLTFDAQESIVFADPVPDAFYPRYTYMVDAAERYAYVVPGKAEVFEQNLKSVGGAYRKWEVAGYAVFEPLSPAGNSPLRPVSREKWKVTAGHAATEAEKAVDRDLATSWRTRTPQRPGDYFELDLGEIRRIGQVALVPGRAPRTSPRAFRVEVSTDGALWQTAHSLPSTSWGPYWPGPGLRVNATGTIVVHFPPIAARWVRLTLLAEDNRWEWSIRELFVSEVSPEDPPSVVSPAVEALRWGLERRVEENWPEAVRAFTEAVEKEPDWGEAYAHMLTAYRELGGDPEDPYELALALEQRGLEEPAVSEFRRAVEVFPHSHHTYPLLRILRHYEAHRRPDRAEEVKKLLATFTPAERIEVSFGGKIRLLGFTRERHEIEPGGEVRLSYFWECVEEMDKDYIVFVHFRRDGEKFGDDHSPLGGLYPTSRWRKGEVIRVDRVIRVPQAVKPGALTVRVGVWDPRSGKKLPTKGDSVRGDWVEMTRFLVAQSPRGS